MRLSGGRYGERRRTVVVFQLYCTPRRCVMERKSEREKFVEGKNYVYCGHRSVLFNATLVSVCTFVYKSEFSAEFVAYPRALKDFPVDWRVDYSERQHNESLREACGRRGKFFTSSNARLRSYCERLCTNYISISMLNKNIKYIVIKYTITRCKNNETLH